MEQFDLLGMLDAPEVDLYSNFNIELMQNVDSTSPLWSKILQTALAAGSMAAVFL